MKLTVGKKVAFLTVFELRCNGVVLIIVDNRAY